MKWHVASFSGGALFACVCLASLIHHGSVELKRIDAVSEASASLASSDGGFLGAVSSTHRALLAEDGSHEDSSDTRTRTRTSKSSSRSKSDMSFGTSTSSDALTGRQLLYQGGDFSAAWRWHYGSSKSRWHPTVLRSVVKAEEQLNISREERSGRLFVPMLSHRHNNLCCMLTNTNAKLRATNKVDVFIFSLDNAAQAVYNESPCAERTMDIGVVFLALDEHWVADPQHSSSAYHDMDGWVATQFKDKYRRMGHWRLTFQFAFADMLGYKYVWQLDDDSFIKKPVDFNVIQFMQEHDLWVASAQAFPDPFYVTWGLPEIARLFLVGERMAPPGTLFSNHTQPPGLEGLYTVRNDTLHTEHPLQGDPGGWSRTIMYGNCVIIDMDKFWWPKQVQKFVELVVQSGYHFRFRWNEQGVMAMVWQIFVPEGHFQVDNLPIDCQHPHYEWDTCPTE